MKSKKQDWILSFNVTRTIGLTLGALVLIFDIVLASVSFFTICTLASDREAMMMFFCVLIFGSLVAKWITK